MEAHTPGPWKVDKELTSRSGEWLISMDAGDKGRGIAIAETRVATGAELANARLLASAPELLMALQKAVRRQGFSNNELIDARAAIKQATGQ